MRSSRRSAILTAILLGATGCIPYTVGSTAQTVAAGRTASSTTYYFIPNALKQPEDSVGIPLYGVDREWRHGLDTRSDIGLRLTSGAGAVINYKRRVREANAGAPAVAYMVGSGIVNGGEHLHLEATLIASGNEAAPLMAFGGLRAMQVVPISTSAVNDSPTIGGFAGVQIGDGSFTLRPELGVFYDRSALGLRSSSVIFVPALTLQRGRRRDDESSRPRRQSEERSTRLPGPGALIGCVLFLCPR